MTLLVQDTLCPTGDFAAVNAENVGNLRQSFRYVRDTEEEQEGVLQARQQDGTFETVGSVQVPPLETTFLRRVAYRYVDNQFVESDFLGALGATSMSRAITGPQGIENHAIAFATPLVTVAGDRLSDEPTTSVGTAIGGIAAIGEVPEAAFNINWVDLLQDPVEMEIDGRQFRVYASHGLYFAASYAGQQWYVREARLTA